MKHFSAYVAVAALMHLPELQGTTASSGGCATAAWYQHTDEISCIPPVEFNASSQFVSMYNGEFANLNLGSELSLPAYTFSQDGYTYEFSIGTDNAHATGISDVSLSLTSAVTALEVSVTATSEGLYEVDLGLTATLSQVSPGLCLDSEEEFLLFCYKPCAELNPEYPIRIGSHTCQKNGCDPGQDEQLGLCYEQPRSGYTCVGVACGSNCPDGYTTILASCVKAWAAIITRDLYVRPLGTDPHAIDINGLFCSGYGVSSSGGCPEIASKRCYGQPITYFTLWNVLFNANDACPDMAMKFNGKLLIDAPQAVLTTEIAINSCTNPVDLDTPGCNRARPGDFLGQFANSAFDASKQALFSRVQDVRVTNVSLADLGRSTFSLTLTDNGGVPPDFVAYGTNKASCIITQESVVNALQGPISENIMSVANQVIGASLAPYFGNTCPDCATCAMAPPPPGLRCQAGASRLLSTLTGGNSEL